MANQPSQIKPVYQTADVPAGVAGETASDIPETIITKEENQMADVDTTLLSQQHSDIRREAVEHTNEIVKEGLKGDYATQKAISDIKATVLSI